MDVMNIVLLISFGVVMYFFFLLPQRRQQKQRDEFFNNLKNGDSVVRIVQFGDSYNLTIVHSRSSISVPEIDWGSNTSYYSAIGWGDGYSETFAPNLHHEYDGNNSSIRVNICSDVLPEQVILQDVKGIDHIDLTLFQQNQ